MAHPRVVSCHPYFSRGVGLTLRHFSDLKTKDLYILTQPHIVASSVPGDVIAGTRVGDYCVLEHVLKPSWLSQPHVEILFVVFPVSLTRGRIYRRVC